MLMRIATIGLIGSCLAGASLPGVAVTLDDLVTDGGTITVGNVTFSNFDFVLVGAGTPEFVEAQDITVTGVSSGTDQVTLEFTIAPALTLPTFDDFYEFEIAYLVSVAGGGLLSEVGFTFEQAAVTNDTIIELIDNSGAGRDTAFDAESPLPFGVSQAVAATASFAEAFALFSELDAMGDTSTLGAFSATYAGAGIGDDPIQVSAPSALALWLPGMLALLWRANRRRH